MMTTDVSGLLHGERTKAFPMPSLLAHCISHGTQFLEKFSSVIAALKMPVQVCSHTAFVEAFSCQEKKQCRNHCPQRCLCKMRGTMAFAVYMYNMCGETHDWLCFRFWQCIPATDAEEMATTSAAAS